MQYCPNCRATYRSNLSFCPRDGTPLTLGPDPLLGQVLAGRYRVISRIGKGGMGQVYLAEHVEIGKRFAVKVLFGDLASNDKMLARFKREAKTASILKHIHIISVTDFGSTEQGLAFLSMELLSGKSLAQIIEKEGPLSVNRTIHIGKQIASALAHAHDKGILHRDLKPENVMVEDREEGSDFITVLDFGLARILQSKNTIPEESLTVIGTVQGTPEFMSPEQAQGLSLGPPSDLYALGLLLYCMLSQELPFPLPPKRSNMLALHAFEPPRPLSQLVQVPKAVEAVVMRLLEKEPAQRFASGRDIVFALDDALAANEKARRSSSALDTWDEDVNETLSDSKGPPSEPNQQEESEGAQTIRMIINIPSILDLEQTATESPQQPEEAASYVVISSRSGGVPVVPSQEQAPSEVEQTTKAQAKPVAVPNKIASMRLEDTNKNISLPEELEAERNGTNKESLGLTYKIPMLSPAVIEKATGTQSNIIWFLAGLFLVLATVLVVLLFGH
jgi:eukaryotic-like serine/threonine-protein kinase